MAVKLKTDEVTVVTQTLEINQEITDEDKRPLGLACAEVVENFDWDSNDPGHDVLKQLLKDVKNALGVRVSRKKDKPKKKRASKKATKKKVLAETETEDVELTSSPTPAASAAKPNGTAVEETTEPTTPPETGAALHDPFAVPSGDSA